MSTRCDLSQSALVCRVPHPWLQWGFHVEWDFVWPFTAWAGVEKDVFLSAGGELAFQPLLGPCLVGMIILVAVVLGALCCF